MSAHLVIERMEEEDLPGVLAIERASFSVPWTEGMFLREMELPFSRLYVARSPGPDRWYIGSPQRLNNWMAYDASNGLISVGDMMVTDKGILGISFAGQEGPVSF